MLAVVFGTVKVAPIRNTSFHSLHYDSRFTFTTGLLSSLLKHRCFSPDNGAQMLHSSRNNEWACRMENLCSRSVELVRITIVKARIALLLCQIPLT
jgi:hypothetical protein